eukprot:gene49079-60077_t
MQFLAALLYGRSRRETLAGLPVSSMPSSNSYWSSTMHDASTPIVFQRHNHQLRTVMVDNQPWFVAHDFARLIGALRPYCMTRLVDPHQRRVVVLRHASGGREEVLAISEAGAYRLLYRFNHPEHRGISRWLSEEVVPILYDQHRDDEATPRR